YASLYGHLLQRAQLRPGQVVKKGQPIAQSGDPDGTCYSRPHLHLEIRSRSYVHWYNPILFIEADWDALALTGSFSRGFEKDLDNPRRWQPLYDQPDADGGSPPAGAAPDAHYRGALLYTAVLGAGLEPGAVHR